MIGIAIDIWTGAIFGAGSGGPSADAILTETGDYLLTEEGDYILME